MTLGASTMSVMADDTTPYTYKVTLSAGNKGTINGQNKIEQTNIASGSTVTFNLNDIQVTDDKYYVKGIRLSGRDNNETLAAPSFTVDKDADYVVAYGIKGNMVAYTVNYQDASGNSLAESQTFYGNVGDKPVVAYRYVENYIPDALALTKTLSDNESENVFTFTYTPGATDRIVETTTTVTTQSWNRNSCRCSRYNRSCRYNRCNRRYWYRYYSRWYYSRWHYSGWYYNRRYCRWYNECRQFSGYDRRYDHRTG